MPTNGVAADHVRSGTQPTQTKRRTSINAPNTGQWALGKTIGAGSMGKVKLAKQIESGEQVRPPSPVAAQLAAAAVLWGGYVAC